MWLLYPFLMAFVIVATANHFIFDALLGALTAGAPPTARAGSRGHGPKSGASRRRARRLGAGSETAGGPDGMAPVAVPPRRGAGPTGRGGATRAGRSARAQRARAMRNALIESRLTPNAISLTGLALNLRGGGARVGTAVLPRRRRLRRRLDHGHARRALLAHVGQGHAFRRVPRLDARPHRGGRRADRRRGLLRLAGRRVAAAAVVVAVLASLMVSYTRARAEALGVECKVGIATRPVRVVILSIGLIFAQGASLGRLRAARPRPSTCWRRSA